MKNLLLITSFLFIASACASKSPKGKKSVEASKKLSQAKYTHGGRF